MKLKIAQLGAALSFGQILANKRLERGLSIDQAASNFFIPKSFIQTIEENKYERLPDKVYTQAILKKYLRLLGLPVREYLASWEESYIHWQKLKPAHKQARDIFMNNYKVRWQFTPLFWQRSFIAAVTIIFLVYIGWQVEAAIEPTSLTVSYPIDELTTSKRSVEVWGETESEAKLLINNQEVTVGVDGSFIKLINLQTGLNILSIEAFKKYRPAQKVVRHILVLDSAE